MSALPPPALFQVQGRLHGGLDRGRQHRRGRNPDPLTLSTCPPPRRGTKPQNRGWLKMKITEELLRIDLAVLNHGGAEAISLFLEMGRRLHEAGRTDAL